MTRFRYPMLAVWAARDVLRRPWDSLLSGIALALVVWMLATALLLTESLARTAEKLFASAPSLVVRRIDAGGWAPMPAGEALQSALRVPGVTSARIRLWGVASGPAGPVTVVGAPSPFERLPGGTAPPAPGQAVIGPGLRAPDGRIALTGVSGRSDTFAVVGRFGRQTAIFAHDLVLLHPADARGLLGLPSGYGSDLAVDVFHAAEEAAIQPDLAEAFPWPVRITSRTESVTQYRSGMFRRGGIAALVGVPAILALVLIVAATVRRQFAGRIEVGLLKSFGWQTGDIVRMHLYRSLCIGLPAVAAGGLAAYAVVFWAGATWVGRWLLGWSAVPVVLGLDPTGAAAVLSTVAALALVPYLSGVLLPAVHMASADVQEFLEEAA